MKTCVECGKEKSGKSQKCHSCANKGKEKLGKKGPFYRKCCSCEKDVAFEYQRSFSLSLKHDCYCEECRRKRFSRECPSCGEIIYTSCLSRAKRFEGKKCKSCETLERVTLKRGYGFSGTYNSLFFRSSLELSFLLITDLESVESGEKPKWKIEYEIDGKKHFYFPDYISKNKMVEIKPLFAQCGKVFAAKKEAAEKFCSQKNMIYEVTDPPAISKEELLRMHNEGTINLNPKTIKMISKNSCE